MTLRSRCLLIPEHSPRLEMVGRGGDSPVLVGVDRESARRLLSEASGSVGAGGHRLGGRRDRAAARAEADRVAAAQPQGCLPRTRRGVTDDRH